MTDFPLNERGGWIVPDGTYLPAGAAVPAHSQLGSECTLGNGCRLGDECNLGKWCNLGDRCTLGNHLTIDGIANARLLCLSNVDGSGRQIILIAGDQGTVIRAGCFRGTVDEFSAKALAEGKHIYAAVVTAAAEAFVNSIKDRCK